MAYQTTKGSVGRSQQLPAQKERPPKRAPECPVSGYDYIFFSEHALFAASHMPPAFSQSAWVFAVVTSPAKAGPVTATATASAIIDTKVFIDLLHNAAELQHSQNADLLEQVPFPCLMGGTKSPATGGAGLQTRSARLERGPGSFAEL